MNCDGSEVCCMYALRCLQRLRGVSAYYDCYFTYFFRSCAVVALLEVGSNISYNIDAYNQRMIPMLHKIVENT